MKLRTILLAALALSFAMTAFAGSTIYSTGHGLAKRATRGQAYKAAKHSARKNCRDKNKQAVCKAKGYKKGSKKIKKCKKSLSKSKFKYQKRKSKCAMMGMGNRKCQYWVKCWYGG